MSLYDPLHYWLTRGDTYAAKFQAERYRDQEQAIREVLAGLDEPRGILDVGCGFGRIGAIARELWPLVRYTGLDLSPAMLEQAQMRIPDGRFVERRLADFRPGIQKWDLVIAVEFLMHVPPADVTDAAGRLLGLARKALVTCDWTVPVEGRIGGHNFIHDYEELFSVASRIGHREVALQTIYTVML